MKFATVGTSWITDSFIDSLKTVDGAELYAVCSRNAEKAENFRKKHGAALAYSSLESAACDGEIDAVYIASPNAFHYEQALLFLESGKNVICEKPLCTSPEKAEELFRAAEKNGVYLTEAVMSIHNPDRKAVCSALERLGTVRSAHLDFSQLSSKYPAYLRGERPNIFLPSMGAGCLMDLGVYNLYLMYILFGEAEKISAEAAFLDTGADSCGSASALCSGKVISLSYSKTAQSVLPSQVLGDRGVMLIDSVSQLGDVKIIMNDKSEQIVASARTRTELTAFEIKDFIAYCTGGHADISYEEAKKASLAVSRMMLEIRKSAGGFMF